MEQDLIQALNKVNINQKENIRQYVMLDLYKKLFKRNADATLELKELNYDVILLLYISCFCLSTTDDPNYQTAPDEEIKDAIRSKLPTEWNEVVPNASMLNSRNIKTKQNITTFLRLLLGVQSPKDKNSQEFLTKYISLIG